MPPITAPGTVPISADNFPIKEHTIESTAAPAMTYTLYTLVTAITPIFSPYVVVGTEPIKPEIIVEKLSAKRERCNPGSLSKFLPTTFPVTI